ncbi:DUF3429 domain-containing protein [Phenylobacterium sp.]|uniref:DUF3429 domain-containing protein n=1 Tax=Phenylobacterium sp. TaxID=1871053 RepID=UPI002FDAA1D2
MAKPSLPRIPPAAAGLGAAGLIPFVGLAAASHLAPEAWRSPALEALTFYGAIILSFMGGAQWGLAVAAGERRLHPYGVSVLPALLAWALLAAPRGAGLLGLAAGLILLLVYDLSTVRGGEAPHWYGALRWRLTLVAALSLIAAALAPAAAFAFHPR